MDDYHQDEDRPEGDEATVVEEPTRVTGPGVPWRLGVFLVLTVLAVIFVVQNTQAVQLRFLAWEWRPPLAVVILVAVVVTVILDEILGGIFRRRRVTMRREREELRRLRDR